jgi:UDP-glucose 4-epimerase
MDMTGVYTEVLIRWLNAIEVGQPPLIFGDGSQSLDFVYVEDVARAYLLGAQKDVDDEVFNVGTGVQTSLNDLCHMLLRITGSSLQPEYREARRVGNVQRRQAGVDKAERMLGFRATVSLEAGLQKFIRWRKRGISRAALEAL